jgi:hypothetical protein
MADENIEVSASSAAEQSVNTDSQAAPEVNKAAQPAEKMLSQSEVNKIAGLARNEGYEKARKEFDTQTQVQQPMQVEQPPQVQQTGQQNSEYDLQKIVNEKVDSKLQEEQQKLLLAQQQQEAERIYSNFTQKLQTGKEKYSDFEDRINELFTPDPNGKVSEKLARIASEAAELDNTADVIYELASNPASLAKIGQLQDISLPRASAALKELSESIKANQNAANVKRPNAPLSQVQPSPTRADNGVMTVNDLRKSPELKA